MRMYILILDDVSVGHAIVAAAHGSLAAYLKFEDSAETREWVAGPFAKVICGVSGAQFEKAKSVGDHVVLTESSLDGREVGLAFRPREDWPKFFRHFSLFGERSENS